MPGTWKTTGGGGGGSATPAMVIAAVLLVACVAGPVAFAATQIMHAVVEFVRVVLIVVASLLGLGFTGLMALLGLRVWRWHLTHPRRAPLPRHAAQAIVGAVVDRPQVDDGRRPAIEAPRSRWLYGVTPGERAGLPGNETPTRDRQLRPPQA